MKDMYLLYQNSRTGRCTEHKKVKKVCKQGGLCTGIIKFGKTVVPFDNTVEKDSELYKLYNTNIYEKFEAKKARNT